MYQIATQNKNRPVYQKKFDREEDALDYLRKRKPILRKIADAQPAMINDETGVVYIIIWVDELGYQRVN